MAVIAVGLVSGIGCSNDKEPQTNTTQQDIPLLTSGEAASLVYHYLDSRLEGSIYRTRLNVWGGNSGAVYAGNHKWNVFIFELGTWSVYERTQVVEANDLLANTITRDHFK